jgi:Uncharacterized vancomycin resistance protein
MCEDCDMKKSVVLLGGLTAAAAVVIVSMWFYASNAVKAAESDILENVSVSGIDVGGMTKAEAENKLDEYISSSEDNIITLKAGDKTESFTYAKLKIRFDTAKAAEEAYYLGRKGNVFRRAAAVYKAGKNGTDIAMPAEVSRKTIKKLIMHREDGLVSHARNARIVLRNGKGQIIKSKNGHKIVYGESVTAVQDAVQNEWKGKDITVKLAVTAEKPQYTAKDFKGLTDVMGKYTTDFSGSALGRCRNIAVGASKINGSVIEPGEEFSVYNTVSPMNAENGYFLAPTIVGEKHIDDYGGGICQVATTLYNAVIRAELKVVERHSHSMAVYYVPLSADATIANEDTDFRFRNNKKSSIYIYAKTHGSEVTMVIFGRDTRSKNRKVGFESVTTSVIKPGRKVVEKDPDLAKGKIKIKEQGITGYTAQLWKIVKVNGKVKSRTLFNSSSYSKVDAKVIKGTKKKTDTNKDNADNDDTNAKEES